MWWLVSSLFLVCRSFLLMWQESKERDPMPLPFYRRELILSWGPCPYTCCCSVTQLSATLCNPMDCSKPSLLVPHHLLKFVQIHFHWISDAIQPSHPLLPSSPSAFNLSQNEGLFQRVGCLPSGGQSIGASASASALPMSIQGRFPLKLTSLISLLSKGLSGVFSSTTVQKHQFFGTLPSLWSNSHHHMWLLGRPWPWLYRSLSAK